MQTAKYNDVPGCPRVDVLSIDYDKAAIRSNEAEPGHALQIVPVGSLSSFEEVDREPTTHTAAEHERAQLEEMGYPHEAVRLLSDEKAKLIYEAEVDAAHEATGGESRRWDHEIQPFADVLDKVRQLAIVPDDAEYALLLGRLAVIRGNIPPAVWTLID